MSAPTNPNAIKATIADPTASVCGNMISTLLKFPVLIYQLFNWMLDSSGNLSPAFAAAVSSVTVKPGDLIFSAAPLDTVGRLLCNGATVSRVTYAALFTALGTTYGAGDGSTTFRLPDYRDKFPIGAGSTYGIGATGGEMTHVLLANEIPAHSHPLANIGLGNADGNDNGSNEGVLFSTVAGGGAYGGSTGDNVGGGAAHNNLPPYVAVFIYIKT